MTLANKDPTKMAPTEILSSAGPNLMRRGSGPK